MTKWARMRRRRKERRAETKPTSSISEENETKLTKPETVFKKTQQQQTQKLEANTAKSYQIISQIPRYIYLVAIFALLSGIFFPLITQYADAAFNFAIGGTATLFLGLVGGIMLFKATTSDKGQIIFVAVGLALIAVSLLLVYVMLGLWHLEFGIL